MSLDGFTSVAVLAPLEQPLTYSIPDELKERLSPGQRVVVPLGRRKSVGVILGEEKNPPTMTCKPIESLLEEEPTFTQSQLEFLKWAADYYLVPIGEMLRVALPGALAKVKGSGKKKVTGYRLQGIATVDLESKNESRKLTLTESQRKIVETIFTKENESKFSVHLIHGITGSGKTEIYLECIRQRLQQGYQVISLVPEIGLTPQTLKRYTQYFEGKIGIYHSDLSENERARIWQACQKGEISILIGTRSALFAPFRNLGLIVIDEEQDSSYKQEERVRYHARDLAIVRAKIEKIPILLGSATPSVETYAKAQSGKFFYHTLSERFGNAELPKIEVVDLLKEKEKSPKKTSLLSTRLLEEIKINLDRQEQTLIFLNRRGFSHFLLCQDCGETPKCSNCDLTLTFHRRFKKLICHYCDYQMPPPDHCLKCSGGDWMPVGSGTERIEEELQSHFPQARIARMDRDTTTRRGAHQKILEKLARHEIDILVGTQMITKGHDYPLVTLVGILSADTALHHPDFRAAEETFQLITQVAGRAGRAQNPGRV